MTMFWRGKEPYARPRARSILSNEKCMIEELIRTVNELAYKSAKDGNGPFSELFVKNGKIVSTSFDLSVRKSSPTAHAELDLIRTYCAENKIFFLEGYTLVSSAEPCIMCSGAIHWSRISKVIFSVSQEKLKQAISGNKKPKCSELINFRKYKIKVVGPVLEDEDYQVFIDFPMMSKIDRHKVFRNNYQ